MSEQRTNKQDRAHGTDAVSTCSKVDTTALQKVIRNRSVQRLFQTSLVRRSLPLLSPLGYTLPSVTSQSSSARAYIVQSKNPTSFVTDPDAGSLRLCLLP